MERKPCARIRPEESGVSLIEWLVRRFTYLSHGQWMVMIAETRVGVNGSPSSAERILVSGDLVGFDPPRYEEPPVDDRIEVAYEDDEYLIVIKSGSLPCHPGGRFFEHTLWKILLERYEEVHIATRLDRETSGLVLVCKSSGAARYVQGLQVRGLVHKEYLAWVEGSFPDSIEARGFIVSDEHSEIRKKKLYVPETEAYRGRDSEACFTGFERLRLVWSERGPFSLLLVLPRSGRTHQIRSTLKTLGYPIVGDKLYGPDEGIFLRFAKGTLDEKDLNRLMLPNQALHCSRISFPKESGGSIDASSPPPWDSSSFESLSG
jgi:RluA family pseudouridine synthase